MSSNPEYLVPSAYGVAELVEKRSRFIGRVWPVETEEEAQAKITETREKHWDATHNVYAYILREGSVTRFSDDGEPHGTSGMPTLEVFRSGGIFNVCCVVTRYFGGVLLGTGGLARAYSAAAKMALDAAGISAVRLWRRISFTCPYNLYERIRIELENSGGFAESTDYGENVGMHVLLSEEMADVFLERLSEVSAGSVKGYSAGSEYIAGKI